jgi:3'-phosphoadenosine 5'-phosphosulfate sulfotransferase (PAPS reductase)/FAD synthetase
MSEQLIFDESIAVIDEAFGRGAEVMAPLLSGGHDSFSAVYLASKHPKFDGNVFHIDTGIGSKITRAFVDDICFENRWNLIVSKSPSTFEMFVRERGFPGPGMHQWAYVRLKERCIRMIMKFYGKANVALITGCRSQESSRRMGHVEPIKIGEIAKKKTINALGGVEIELKVVNKRRYWIAPCHGWSTLQQHNFMNAEDLPRNPIKQTPLGMSGECFCGSFARPNEIQMVRQFVPDVAQEIDRLAIIAKDCGKHCTWGTRPDKRKGIVAAPTGPLCNSCDVRATAAGLFLTELSS